MSLPKEPRQKMINMMYLVLTALLALNVSSEILNAFKTVNNSITTSNMMIDSKNKSTFEAFDAKLADEKTRAKAQIWKPKADKAKQLSESLYAYIDDLKLRLKLHAKLKMKAPEEGSKDSVEQFNEDHLEAAVILMDKEGEGKKLYERLGQYRADMLAVLNPADYAQESPQLQADIKAKRAELEKTLPIDLSIPPSKSGNKRTGDPKVDWVNNYFHMTPAVAGLTILSKFQNDVRNSEAQMVDYLYKKIGDVAIVYDKFQAIAQSNTSYAMPNDEIEITAGVGAFSAAAKPEIYINGQKQPLSLDGTAIYKTKASGVGEKVVDVRIEYFTPEGTKETVTKKVKYEVGIPSGASIFLEKMNVMYLDVENPVTISGGSVGSEKVKVSFSAGSISKAGGDRYVAVPKGNPGPGKITVMADGKPFTFDIRVKNLPSPAGFVGTKKGGTMPAAEFKVMRGVIAKLEESEFVFPFKVISYKVGAVGGPISIYAEETNSGNSWNGQAGALINRAGPGTTVFFDQIIVEGPGGKKREISPMKFNLR
jgi:gliding motility-associated protein GldM